MIWEEFKTGEYFGQLIILVDKKAFLLGAGLLLICHSGNLFPQQRFNNDLYFFFFFSEKEVGKESVTDQFPLKKTWKSFGVIEPYNRLKWDILLLILILYTALMVPFRAAWTTLDLRKAV